MNRALRTKEAEEFVKNGDAYIHTEVRKGVAKTMLSGDPRALIIGICGEVSRFAELFGGSVTDVCRMISGASMMERKDIVNMLDIEIDLIDENVCNEYEMNEQIKNITENTSKIISKLEKEVERLKSENRLQAGEVVNVKKNYEARLKEKDKTIQSLQKDINSLEADLRRMEQIEE